jgi:hypothetical protein
MAPARYRRFSLFKAPFAASPAVEGVLRLSRKQALLRNAAALVAVPAGGDPPGGEQRQCDEKEIQRMADK